MRFYEHVLYSYIDCFQFPFSLRSVDNRNEDRNEKVSTTKVNMGLKGCCLRPSPKDNFAKATYHMSGDLMEIYETREQTNIRIFILEGPRPCTIFCLVLTH